MVLSFLKNDVFWGGGFKLFQVFELFQVFKSLKLFQMFKAFVR